MANSSTLNFILSLTDKVSKPLKTISAGFNNIAEQGKNNAKLMAAGVGTVFGAFKGLQASLTPAIEMNKALADVKSYGIADNALKKLNNTALDFTATYGTSAVDFVNSTKTINQSIKGLTDNQLINFTKATNLLGVDSKKGAESAANYMATVYGGFKNQIDGLGKSDWVKTFASQTAVATRIFRTDLDKLNDAFKESGSLAGQYGVSVTDQLAAIGTLGNTMDGGQIGGGLKAMFENVGSASQKLGLSFTDNSGRMLGMVEIIDKLNGKFGDLSIDKNARALRDAFGGGADAVMQLMKNTDQLKGGIAQLGKIHGLEHIQTLAEQSVDPWKRMNGQIDSMRTSFGQALLPALIPVLNKFVSIGETLQRWSVLFPNLTKLVGILAVSFLAINVAVGMTTLAVGLVKNVWLALSVVCKVLTLGLNMQRLRWLAITAIMTGVAIKQGIVTAAQWAFNTALFACPLVWIIAAIIAAIAVIGVCIYYWDDITAAVSNFAAFIMGGFTSAMDWIVEKFNAVGEWFTSMGSWSGLLKKIWLGYLQIIAGAIDKIIEYINYIPGVNIEFRAANHLPDFSGIEEPTQKLKKASQGVIDAQRTNGTGNSQGIMANYMQLQSQNGQSLSKTIQIENFTVSNSKPMTQGELQNMVQMAGG